MSHSLNVKDSPCPSQPCDSSWDHEENGCGAKDRAYSLAQHPGLSFNRLNPAEKNVECPISSQQKPTLNLPKDPIPWSDDSTICWKADYIGPLPSWISNVLFLLLISLHRNSRSRMQCDYQNYHQQASSMPYSTRYPTQLFFIIKKHISQTKNCATQPMHVESTIHCLVFYDLEADGLTERLNALWQLRYSPSWVTISYRDGVRF